MPPPCFVGWEDGGRRLVIVVVGLAVVALGVGRLVGADPLLAAGRCPWLVDACLLGSAVRRRGRRLAERCLLFCSFIFSCAGEKPVIAAHVGH